MTELTWRAVALGGLVLAIISIWLDAVGGSSYWDDGTQGVLALIVAVVAALLLVVSWTQRRAQPARVACALSFFLLGYFLFAIAWTAFGAWDQLDAGAWLALVGALVAVVGSWLGSKSQGTEPVMTSAAGQRGVQMGVAVAFVGLVLCVISIWLDVVSGASYWQLSDDKMLGIVMLVLCGITGAALLGTWTGRGQNAALWASLLGMTVLGLYALLPVTAAFNQFGELEIGGWLGIIGALAVAAGAELAHMATARDVRVAAPAPAV